MKKIIIGNIISLLLCIYSATSVYGLTDGNIPVPTIDQIDESFTFDALYSNPQIEEIPVYVTDKTFLKEKTHWEYNDGSASIVIDKIWYADTNVYVARINFSDYSRFHTVYDVGTTASVASNYSAILAVNCDYATNTGYPTIRSGSVINDGTIHAEATYSSSDGYLRQGGGWGSSASDAASSGTVTDTFQFGPAFLSGGNNTGGSGGRAQRTFIGTNGSPGNIVIGVSSGRYADGVSAGLTYAECAEILQNYGCTFGVPLDGGGSSTMIFNGTVLVGSQRSNLGDFIYFR